MHERVREALEREGFVLPEPAKPLAAYIPAVRSGSLAMSSGQLPTKDGELLFRGKVPVGISLADAQAAARLAAVNALAALSGVVDLDEIRRVVRVGVFVQSDAGFHEQHKVANGASELLGAVLGDAGVHARSAIGVIALPLDAAVEVEVLVSL